MQNFFYLEYYVNNRNYHKFDKVVSQNRTHSYLLKINIFKPLHLNVISNVIFYTDFPTYVIGYLSFYLLRDSFQASIEALCEALQMLR